MTNSIVTVDIEEIMDEIREQIRREQAESIDVEQIMREIRAQLNDVSHEAVPAFSEVINVSVPISLSIPTVNAETIKIIPDDNGIVQQISNEAQYLKANAYYPYYQEMGKGPKGFTKRVVRKLNKCILFPIHEHQNEFNLHTANGIDALRIGSEYHQIQLNNVQEVLNDQQKQQKKAQNAQHKNLEMQGEQIEGLSRRLESHQEEIDQLREQIDFGRSEAVDALDARLLELEGRLNRLQSEIVAHGEALDGQRREIGMGNAKLRELRHSQDIQRMAFEAQQRELVSQGERLGTIAGQQNALTEQQNALVDSLESQQSALDEFNGQLADIRSGMADHGRSLEGQQGALDAFNGQLADIRSGMADHGRSLEGQQFQLNSHKSALDTMKEAVQRHEQSLVSIDRSIDEMSLSIARTIRHYLAAQSTQDKVAKPAVTQTTQGNGENSSETVTTAEVQAQNDYEVLDYFKFENDFRGTQSQIMERQKIYLPYFRGRKGRVFDFGCGRGEFLRLLKAEGIPAYGMDMYEEYEITGQLNGIDITTGDAFAELERVEEPLGGIFCAQVIEHIGFRNIQKLCKLAYDKLEKDACLVLETLNPMCVFVFTNAFYIDPTHEKPVHPLMMEYLLKSTGFSEVQLLWPDHSLEPLPKIKGNGIENLDEVNRAIERVSNLLFGSQDYAVIARK